MKHPEIIVQIPEPCHEDWNKMNPTEKGKFCNVCTKEVIDFSAESDEEIVTYFSKNGNVCGRFHETQLNRKLIADRKKRNHWLSYAASLLLPITLFSQEVKKDSQNIPKTEQTNSKDFKSLNIGSLHKQGKIKRTVQNDSIIVKGVITDDTGLPLPAATILIKGTNTGKTTDFDGNYTIKVQEGNEITISYVGYESITQKIEKNKFTYNASLKYSHTLEEYVIVGYGVLRKSLSGIAGAVTTVNLDDIKKKKEHTKNYFEFQKKKWKEKREKRRAKRAERKAERAKRDSEKN